MKLSCAYDEFVSEFELSDKQQALLNEIAMNMGVEPSEACINLVLDFLEMHEQMRDRLPNIKKLAN